MALAFDKDLLQSSPVPHMPLDHPRLRSRIYQVRNPDRGPLSGWCYAPTPWRFQDCVPSVWINRWTYDLVEVTFVGLDRFDRIGLGAKGDDEHPYLGTWMGWHDSVGLWRGFGDYSRGPLMEAYVVEHWLRWDVLSRDERADLLRHAVAYHNQESQSNLQRAKESKSASTVRFHRRTAERHARGAQDTLRALAEMGEPVDLADLNRGREGQLVLF